MQEINLEVLSKDAFDEFGWYTNMIDPIGYSLDSPRHKFFRDKIIYPNNTSLPTAFSVLQVIKPQDFTVGGMEYHNYTPEAMMPLDGDVIIGVAPANGGETEPEAIRAFLVPQGTMVMLRTAVWHALPMSLKSPFTNMLIVLPERVYHNDLVLGDLEEEVKVNR